MACSQLTPAPPVIRPTYVFASLFDSRLFEYSKVSRPTSAPALYLATMRFSCTALDGHRRAGSAIDACSMLPLGGAHVSAWHHLKSLTVLN